MNLLFEKYPKSVTGITNEIYSVTKFLDHLQLFLLLLVTNKLKKKDGKAGNIRTPQ